MDLSSFGDFTPVIIPIAVGITVGTIRGATKLLAALRELRDEIRRWPQQGSKGGRSPDNDQDPPPPTLA